MHPLDAGETRRLAIDSEPYADEQMPNADDLEGFDGADYLTHLDDADYALDARERELGRQRLAAFGVGPSFCGGYNCRSGAKSNPPAMSSDAPSNSFVPH